MAPSLFRPRVVLLRGHHANVWDLAPWERLLEQYDVRALVTGANLHQTSGLGIPVERIRTPRDVLPRGRVGGGLAYLAGERYLALEPHLQDAHIVHAAEIGTWFSAQAAQLKSRLGFKLVLSVWETIPWRETYRWSRERGYRRAVLSSADRYLAATARARDGLRLEGVARDLIDIGPPGVDVDRFGNAADVATPSGDVHRILSAGRLVWEKGHQDVLRALAALRGGLLGPPRSDVELDVVGSGPEERRLKRYAEELGVAPFVRFVSTVPYEEMPARFAAASCLVLASLPVRGWEEQFGMVLVEAMAAGTPVIACATGAIPEVVGDAGALVAAGDWVGLARALQEGPLRHRAPAPRAPIPREQLAPYRMEAAAERLRALYRRVLPPEGR